jgi:mannose-6-phosphate isomerase-like protein (cupin superfamily)
MTRGIEPIKYHKKDVACVYRNSIAVKGIRFLTLPDNPFQIGIHDRKEKTKLPAHIHNCPTPIAVPEIQEVLFVIRGKVRVTILSESNKPIAKKLLSAGDAILLMSQAHQVEFLGNARVFEIKQGPYPGDGHAKKYLA